MCQCNFKVYLITSLILKIREKYFKEIKSFIDKQFFLLRKTNNSIIACKDPYHPLIFNIDDVDKLLRERTRTNKHKHEKRVHGPPNY